MPIKRDEDDEEEEEEEEEIVPKKKKKIAPMVPKVVTPRINYKKLIEEMKLEFKEQLEGLNMEIVALQNAQLTHETLGEREYANRVGTTILDIDRLWKEMMELRNDKGILSLLTWMVQFSKVKLNQMDKDSNANFHRASVANGIIKLYRKLSEKNYN